MTIRDIELKPGMKIRVNGNEYLVGDINILGGVCDDCMAFNRGEEVEIISN